MHMGLVPVSFVFLNGNAGDVSIMLVDANKSDIGICS